MNTKSGLRPSLQYKASLYTVGGSYLAKYYWSSKQEVRIDIQAGSELAKVNIVPVTRHHDLARSNNSVGVRTSQR